MKITIPVYLEGRGTSTAFKKEMNAKGLTLSFQDRYSSRYIWDMYDSETKRIAVVTVDSGRRDGHEEKLLEFVRDEFLGVSQAVFSSIMEERMLTVDNDDPKSFFINFYRLEKFLSGLFGKDAYDLRKVAHDLPAD